MVRKVVTLDIDSASIRLLEVSGRKITKWASASLKRGADEPQAASEQQHLGMTVGQLMKSSGINARKVNASLSGLYTISRVLNIPKPITGSLTEEAILSVAREATTLSEDENYLLWQTIEENETNLNVFFTIVPREAVDDEMKALKAVNISPSVLELKAMALARTVNKSPALLLNVEASSFDVIIVVDGLPQVMRTVPWPKGELTAPDYADHLSATLELTVDFYNSSYPSAIDSATPLSIVGQMSGDPALIEELRKLLTYPVERLAPPLEYPEDFPISQYAVNIGLALRDAVSSNDARQDRISPLSINLLPQMYKPWRPTRKQIYFAGLMILGLALMFPAIQFVSDSVDRTKDMKAKLETLNNQLQLRQRELKEREPLKDAVNEYNTIMNTGVDFAKDLEVINRAAANLNIHLESIVHEGDKIEVTGSADSYIAFREYLIALEGSGQFSTPIPPPEGYPYTNAGTITLKPKTK